MHVVRQLHLCPRLYKLQGRWFKLSVETFDAINYGSLAAYKIGIFLLNLVPLASLYLVS